LAGLLILAAGGVYAALPWLVTTLAAEIVDAAGVRIESLVIERPEIRSTHITRLIADYGDIRVSIDNARLGYRLPRLIEGQFDQLQVERALISVAPATAASHEATAKVAGSGDAAVIDLAALFAAVPFLGVEIARLILEVPEVEFAGSGSVRLEGDTVEFSLAGSSPEQARNLELTGMLNADGVSRLTFSAIAEPSAENPDSHEFLVVDSRIDQEHVAFEMKANLSGYPFRLLSNLAGLPEGSGDLTADLRTQLPWPVQAVEVADLDANGSFQMNWRSPGDDLQIRDLRGTAELSAGVVQTGFSRGEVYYQDENTSAVITVPEFSDGQPLRAVWSEPGLTVAEGVQLLIRQPDLEIAGTAGEISVKVQAEPTFTGSAALTADAFEYLTQGDLTLSAALEDDDVLRGDANWRSAGYDFRFAFAQRLETGSGEVSAAGSIEVAEPLAGALLGNWSQLYDIDAGVIDYLLELSWSDVVEGSLQIDMSDVAAHYDEHLIAGIDGLLEFVIDDGEVSLKPSEMRAAEFDPGVAFTNLAMVVGLDGNKLSVADTGFQLLGGAARVSDFVYDLEQSSTQFQVELEAVDLAQVLSLEGDDIQGDGRISGLLPVMIRDDLPSITEGQLASLPPGGTIRLASDFGAITGQPGLDFAMRALTDYRFTSLEASVDYDQDGELQLGISLKGSNPEVEKGRPIHYNLNITENVLVLLQSLRAQRAVTESLERRVLN
jgi:hypothetical protein